MSVDLFPLREREIFSTLRELHDRTFIVIGGYAVNAYTLPRFSVDCDIVVRDRKELKQIEKIIVRMGYRMEAPNQGQPYTGDFCRFVKSLRDNFSVSLDILIGKVCDRMSGAVFSAYWVMENSDVRGLKGKTIAEAVRVRIINVNAILAMKIASCRPTDIRDVFMLMPSATNKEWITKEIELRCNFDQRISKVVRKITSHQFKDDLAGVYGFLNPVVFDKHKKAILDFSNP